MAHEVAFARKLRRNQTDAERELWFRLRDRRLGGFKFRRQAPVDRYVVDFVCADARLVIELDGGQHATMDETNRKAALESMGFLVLRFWNDDVLQNMNGVLETIASVLNKHSPYPPHPNPLPNGEREQR
ncbi:MAG TPA: DUF559 domain-containing protein [Xanthobacteraceae bacterium]|jgi:very-short-patch-repair endonuclease|nr:DUF559 domain-containing protein [Xanthobacteraceae bacterium]